MIVTIANQKGGTGKTTLATNVASVAAAEGLSVLLVDADRQGSARDWHAAGDGNGVEILAADTPTSVPTIAGLADRYGLIVIDAPPSASAMGAALVKVSDLVIIPVQPSPYDIWACGELVELVKQRQELADGRPVAAFVISRAINRSNLAGDVAGALADYGLPVLKARTVQRVAYASTAAQGRSVLDSDDEAAQAELRELFAEIRKTAGRAIR